MPKHHHILNAASNLLGISLIFITGLHITGVAKRTLADEIAWIAAICLSLSCLFSYLAIRSEPTISRYEEWADRVFLAGLSVLIFAVFVLATIKD
jgi:hypothetical protein